MRRIDETYNENLVGWLKRFADEQAKKNAHRSSVELDEPNKQAHPKIKNILDIAHQNKKQSVEDRVKHYRTLVGLDLMERLEKEGENIEVVEKKASIPLSSRDKIIQAQDQTLGKIKQFVEQIIKNRNGSIAAPAIFEQLENYFKLDKQWLQDNLDEINSIINDAKANFQPQTYNNISPNDLARTDEPLKGEKEPPLFSARPPTEN